MFLRSKQDKRFSANVPAKSRSKKTPVISTPVQEETTAKKTSPVVTLSSRQNDTSIKKTPIKSKPAQDETSMKKTSPVITYTPMQEKPHVTYFLIQDGVTTYVTITPNELSCFLHHANTYIIPMIREDDRFTSELTPQMFVLFLFFIEKITDNSSVFCIRHVDVKKMNDHIRYIHSETKLFMQVADASKVKTLYKENQILLDLTEYFFQQTKITKTYDKTYDKIKKKLFLFFDVEEEDVKKEIGRDNFESLMNLSFCMVDSINEKK